MEGAEIANPRIEYGVAMTQWVRVRRPWGPGPGVHPVGYAVIKGRGPGVQPRGCAVIICPADNR